jgi:hypothetical protein
MNVMPSRSCRAIPFYASRHSTRGLDEDRSSSYAINAPQHAALALALALVDAPHDLGHRELDLSYEVRRVSYCVTTDW